MDRLPTPALFTSPQKMTFTPHLRRLLPLGFGLLLAAPLQAADPAKAP